MKELKIYEYQAKVIEDALRLTSNFHNCSNKETCYDRDVTDALKMIRNIIAEKPDELVKRYEK